MRNSILILLTLLLMACATNKPDELYLFNDLSFKMESGESIAPITHTAKDRYTQYFNSQSIQIPLFKEIKHPHYQIFIGIPYNTTLEAMVNWQLANPDSTTISFTHDSLSYYKRYKNNEFYITEYVKSEKNQLLYISTLSQSKELSDSLFSEQRLLDRIKHQ